MIVRVVPPIGFTFSMTAVVVATSRSSRSSSSSSRRRRSSSRSSSSSSRSRSSNSSSSSSSSSSRSGDRASLLVAPCLRWVRLCSTKSKSDSNSVSNIAKKDLNRNDQSGHCVSSSPWLLGFHTSGFCRVLASIPSCGSLGSESFSPGPSRSTAQSCAAP